LQVRLWDRLFDCYVMDPMQRYIAQLLRPPGERDAKAMSAAVDALGMAYDMIESRMGEHAWAVGDGFSMADCSAAPALFYAATIRPFSAGHARLHAYFERLLARPSVWQAIVQARPFFQYYPLHHALPANVLAD
jgi:glutathione S-transferase